MRKKLTSESGAFYSRLTIAIALCTIAVSLGWFSFAAPPSSNPNAAAAAAPPTFGHPVISGVGGVGFEQNLRIDPSNPNRLYTSVPGALTVTSLEFGM